MMNIDPSETILTGRWLPDNQGGVVADDICRRIERLVHSHLKELGTDRSGWDALYRDPDDDRLWELTYPQGQLHGGGPPQLRNLTVEKAREKYGDVALVC
jgi:hypothetical protein